jgi:hypothetical protein
VEVIGKDVPRVDVNGHDRGQEFKLPLNPIPAMLKAVAAEVRPADTAADDVKQARL